MSKINEYIISIFEQNRLYIAAKWLKLRTSELTRMFTGTVRT